MAASEIEALDVLDDPRVHMKTAVSGMRPEEAGEGSARRMARVRRRGSGSAQVRPGFVCLRTIRARKFLFGIGEVLVATDYPEGWRSVQNQVPGSDLNASEPP